MKNDFFYFHIDVKYQTNHLCQTDCLTTIKICNNAKDLYKYGNNAEKKQLLNYVLQNLTLMAKTYTMTINHRLIYLQKGLIVKKYSSGWTRTNNLPVNSRLLRH